VYMTWKQGQIRAPGHRAGMGDSLPLLDFGAVYYAVVGTQPPERVSLFVSGAPVFFTTVD